MNNPYQSPLESRQETSPSPWWYLLFYRLYGPVWYLGLTLLIFSWFEMVAHAAGGVGIAMLVFAYGGNYLVPRLAGKRPEEFVVLDSRMLKTRGEDYRQTMLHFLDGATLMLDGAAFRMQPVNEIACGLYTYNAELTDSEADEITQHAQSVFDLLMRECPEFESAVCGKQFRISILLRSMNDTAIICRLSDGKNPLAGS
ncbi:hypothetical protein Pan97_12110 [Bremerella volcania]|uniref:Uncharacterized protein n=1 Tax=Bremerella volcania TaxID=2527984 RepID=A0A518C4S6_9BACT|nr:hypothetical protein [Bremerella volcania]QDU74206.1 hypothetical protein Pan97_12110 [Bremerella volcania]